MRLTNGGRQKFTSVSKGTAKFPKLFLFFPGIDIHSDKGFFGSLCGRLLTGRTRLWNGPGRNGSLPALRWLCRLIPSRQGPGGAPPSVSAARRHAAANARMRRAQAAKRMQACFNTGWMHRRKRSHQPSFRYAKMGLWSERLSSSMRTFSTEMLSDTMMLSISLLEIGEAL